MVNEVGWVGWFSVGSIDEHGKIMAIQYVSLNLSLAYKLTYAISDGTAAREHETYDKYLAKQIGWSVDWL